jgi:hypothetical protein
MAPIEYMYLPDAQTIVDSVLNRLSCQEAKR